MLIWIVLFIGLASLGGLYYVRIYKKGKPKVDVQVHVNLSKELNPIRDLDLNEEKKSKSGHIETPKSAVQQNIENSLRRNDLVSESSQDESTSKEYQAIKNSEVICEEIKSVQESLNDISLETSFKKTVSIVFEKENLENAIISEKQDINLVLEKDSSKKAGRNFNFKTNKTKIESLLKKDVSVSSEPARPEQDLLFESISRENVLQDKLILESNEASERKTSEMLQNSKSNSFEPSNATKIVVTESSAKSRGFNFKNPKLISSVSNVIDSKENLKLLESNEKDQVAKETIDSNESRSEKPEEKRPKGFNFRNNNKQKVE